MADGGHFGTQFSQEWARRKVVVKHSINQAAILEISLEKYPPDF